MQICIFFMYLWKIYDRGVGKKWSFLWVLRQPHNKVESHLVRKYWGRGGTEETGCEWKFALLWDFNSYSFLSLRRKLLRIFFSAADKNKQKTSLLNCKGNSDGQFYVLTRTQYLDIYNTSLDVPMKLCFR